MFFVSKKKYQELQNVLNLEVKENDNLRNSLLQKGKDLLEKDKILYSSERKKIILDLQTTLNLIRSYQRSLSMVGIADPNIVEANILLEKYGMKGDSEASYLGSKELKPKIYINKDDILNIQDHSSSLLQDRDKRIQDQWTKEEEEWGDEAYGKCNIGISAEAIDEGDAKEFGYTRAHVKFVYLDEDKDFQTDDTLGP